MGKQVMGIMSKIIFIALTFQLFFAYNASADENVIPLPLNVGQLYDTMESVYDFEEIVSVTYSDSSVARVNLDGVITALKPGQTNIVIVYMKTGGTTSDLKYNVTVELATGYYRIKNKETGSYLSISDEKIKLDPTVGLASYNDADNVGERQIWHVVKQSNKYIIKPYLDENAILFYSMVYDDIRIEKIMTYLDNFVTDSIRNWYVDGDEIYNAYGGYNIDEGYGGVRLSRAKIYGNSYENDTWIFEKIDEVSSGIRLIDEYYDIDNVNERFMSIESTKRLEDLKIRCLRYSVNELDNPIWSSSNTSIVTVDTYTGEVTAVGVGTATITVTQPGLLTNNSASYTINVLPLKDGVYSITNKLGFNQLESFEQNGIFYLQRSNNSNTSNYWYLQTTISGKYFISAVNKKSLGSNFVLSPSTIGGDNSETTYATLSLLSNYSSYVPTWGIRSNELGYSIELEDEAGLSMFILDADDSKAELGSIDYEDYEGMWNINEILEMNGTRKIYIHPYYDNEFKSLFTDTSEAIASLNYYLEYVEDTLEAEFDLQVEVMTPIEMSTSEIDDLNNDGKYRAEVSKTFESIEETDIYYRHTHKYIIYSGYNFSNNVSSNVDDIVLIKAYGHTSYVDAMLYKSLHEISHTLSARDHYHRGDGCPYGGRCTTCGTLELKRPEHCIFHFLTYDKEHPYCNECKMEIIASINAKCFE